MTLIKRILPAAVVALTLALPSCMKEERELAYAKQETKIEQFVEKQLTTYPDARVAYNGGTTRIVISEGDGVELTSRGTAGILFAGYDFTSGSVASSSMFATNNYSFALGCGWDLTDEGIFETLTIDLTDKNVIEGLRSGLEGVREGEECYILFSGRYGFGKDKIGTISANAPLAFHVWVQTVEN